MPTGYTQQLTELDLDLKGFALVCARAFGYLITMRDEPLDAPIPEKFEPYEFHKKELDKAEAHYNAIKGLGNGAFAEQWGVMDIEEKIKSLKEYAAKDDHKKVVRKYNDMLEKVRAWTPPSPEHEPLKNYMIDQLTQSIRADSGHSDYYAEEIQKLEAVEPLEHYKAELQKVKDSIEYHKKHWAEEVERTEKRNEWLSLLRSSLT